MKEPTQKDIDQFIERLIRGKLEDGQLSDCQLSLRDIDQICEAFSDILKGVYHERVEYPKVQPFTVKQSEKQDTPSQEQMNQEDKTASDAASVPSGISSVSGPESKTAEEAQSADNTAEDTKGVTDNAD